MAHIVDNYSAIEKLLHKFAFKSWSPLLSLSDLENTFFKNDLSKINVTKPVFIAALPRAGTTMLLDICVETQEFCSHIYRDMPFLLTPMLWSRFSGIFKKDADSHERAHGDGLLVSVDSPEALEEILWKGFWPSRYKFSHIEPWGENNFPDFEGFLKDHFKKIILLRAGKNSLNGRYISKNNLNISRIAYLKKLFPDSIIVVPFREPFQHASSLLRQHINFLDIHKESSFSSQYMKDVGHYDFGNNLRPVNFDNWLSSPNMPDEKSLEFWLLYWVSAYRYLLAETGDNIAFLSYEALCAHPEQSMKMFGEVIEINNQQVFDESAKRISTPKLYSEGGDKVSPAVLEQAELLYKQLEGASINQ